MKKCLDLFCGVGGATKGYQDNGFYVVGVDIMPQPNYCGDEFIHGDALEYLVNNLHQFDLIHASPPCQTFSAYRRKGGIVGAGYQNLIPETRKLLKLSGKPYIIENVMEAPLWLPIMLCGSSFGLDIRRHRAFESNIKLKALPCNHAWQTPRFPQSSKRKNLRSTIEIGAWRIPIEMQKRAMEIDWATKIIELSEAIPPAYTRYLGKQLLTVSELGDAV